MVLESGPVLNSPFLIGEARYIRKRVDFDGIIGSPHACFCPSLVLYNPERSNTVTIMSLTDLSRLVLKAVDSEMALNGQEASHYWNPVIQKGSRVVDWRLRQSCAARYSLNR